LSRVVGIGCFYEHLDDRVSDSAIVAVDVIRAATTAVTAVDCGMRLFPVPSIEAAVPLAARLHNPLLAGELGGSMPYGFNVQNSPAEIADRSDVERPVILLSTSGTRLMFEAERHGATYVASLRNASATAAHLAEEGGPVMVLGAGSRGEFRGEDKLCCARIARDLLERGFEAKDEPTKRIVAEWGQADDDAFVGGPSSEYLLRTGQGRDLDFVLSHIDDLDDAFELREGELVRAAL
jgi:2-phosphosulfolactate phosphatase